MVENARKAIDEMYANPNENPYFSLLSILGTDSYTDPGKEQELLQLLSLGYLPDQTLRPRQNLSIATKEKVIQFQNTHYSLSISLLPKTDRIIDDRDYRAPLDGGRSSQRGHVALLKIIPTGDHRKVNKAAIPIFLPIPQDSISTENAQKYQNIEITSFKEGESHGAFLLTLNITFSTPSADNSTIPEQRVSLNYEINYEINLGTSPEVKITSSH